MRPAFTIRSDAIDHVGPDLHPKGGDDQSVVFWYPIFEIIRKLVNVHFHEHFSIILSIEKA